MHVFCVYLEFRTVVYFFPLGSYSLDNRPEILLQPQSVDIACFCSSVLNGTTVPRGRVTVCLEDLWVIRWPVMPSLNLVTAVIRHSFCDVVIKKTGQDAHTGCQTKMNLFSVERRECLVEGDRRVSMCQWRRHAWGDIPTNVSRTFSLGSPVWPAPTESSLNAHNNASG